MKTAAKPKKTAAELEAKTLIKWAGGKSRFCKHFNLLRICNNSDSYHVEPFLGGGGSFLHLKKQNAAASDINPDLVNLWEITRDDPASLITSYINYFNSHSKLEYYQQRVLFNSCRFTLQSEKVLTADKKHIAGLFLYLMKTSFNGLCRYSQQGVFNAPCGDSIATIEAVTNTINSVSKKIQNVEFSCCSFEQTIAKYQDRKDVFFYCDPPYSKVNGKGFQEYAGGSWGRTDADLMAKTLIDSGCQFVVSEVDTEQVRNRYPNSHFVEIKANRSIGGSRAKVSELLILSHI